MSNILFTFDDFAQKASAVKAVARAFRASNLIPLVVEPISAVKRTGGVSYREAVLSWHDSQRVTIRVKKDNAVFQVLVNDKAITLKKPDDHSAVIKDIVDALDTKRAAFQAALAKRRKTLPPSLETSIPKLLAELQQVRDSLLVLRDQYRDELAKLSAAA